MLSPPSRLEMAWCSCRRPSFEHPHESQPPLTAVPEEPAPTPWPPWALGTHMMHLMHVGNTHTGKVSLCPGDGPAIKSTCSYK